MAASGSQSCSGKADISLFERKEAGEGMGRHKLLCSMMFALALTRTVGRPTEACHIKGDSRRGRLEGGVGGVVE